MSRPREYDREAIKLAFEQYIDSTEIPIIAEFASNQGFGKHVLYDFEELSNLLKKCTSKKEAALERRALDGDVNVTMAIFSLKQLGWSDKTEQTINGPVSISISNSDAKL